MAITPTRKVKVFLCHSSEDKSSVEDIYQRLNMEGWIDPWLDKEKLLPGQDWDLEIEKAVEEADVVLVFLSNNSVTKEGYVQKELRFVLKMAEYKPEGTIFILPLRLNECPLPRSLRSWHCVDNFPEDKKEWAYGRLLDSLNMRAKDLGLMSKPNQPVNGDPTILLNQLAKRGLINPLHAKIIGSSDFSPADIKVRAPSMRRMTWGGIEFIKIPPGKFLMGDFNGSQLSDLERAKYIVDIPYDYWISRFPVTNGLYSQYIKVKKQKHPVSNWMQKHNHPVSNVSWKEAIEFSKWLNLFLKKELPVGYILRLPTETEWEKAARGTDGLVYPWGNEFDSRKCNSRIGRQNDTTPVGKYSPLGDSPYGCADMAGNVWEWVFSKQTYSHLRFSGSTIRDALTTDGLRVLRGGSFRDDSYGVRCGYSIEFSMFRAINYGFRLCVSIFS